MSIASAFLGAAAGSLGLYWLFLSLQRLLFSPLAKFPGSKLAGLTAWVETYYQMFKGDGGQYTFKILEWHDKYGKYHCYSFK